MALPAVGFQVWGQFTTWPEVLGTCRDIEAHGYASVWTNDHFFPAAGPRAALPAGIDGPVLEGWTTLAGLAVATRRVGLGVLVSGAGYRTPGLVVKQATTIDHLAGGRMSLGLGAGWHVRDHAAFGFDLSSVRERLDRLDEQARAIRGLLDGDEVTVAGRYVAFDRAVDRPRPLNPRMPLMIAGSGRRRTLAIAARFADAWNGEGDVATWADLSATLDGHCAAIGRDPGAIRRTVGLPPLSIRADRGSAVTALAARLEHHGLDAHEAWAAASAAPLVGGLDEVLEVLEAYRAAGAAEVMIDWPAPYDGESLERLAGVAGQGRGVA